MRFLHVADLHIGKRVNGMSLVDDQRHILSQIVMLARERQVDALLIAGDIYDKASPSAEAVAMLDRFLTELVGAGVRVLGVPGNHDSAERIAYAQELLAEQGVCFPPVFDGNVVHAELADDDGPVDVWLLPFLRPGDVRRFFPDVEIGDDYAAALRAALDACEIDCARRNVIVTHQLVTASGIGPDRADDEIKLGGVDAVDVSVYGAFDYVALGHVHRPQRIGRDTARYAGSPLKYSFSEARYAKSAVLVELGPKAEGDEPGACVTFELVPLVPLHDMREVRMSLDELLRLARPVVAGEDAADDALGEDEAAGEGAGADAEGASAADADGAPAADASAARDARVAAADGSTCDFIDDYLHITLTDAHPQMDAMRKIRELYPNAMTLDYDNAVILSAGKRSLTAVDPDELNIAELFARFYEEQVGRPMDAEQEKIVAEAVRDVSSQHARGEKDTGADASDAAAGSAAAGDVAGVGAPAGAAAGTSESDSDVAGDASDADGPDAAAGANDASAPAPARKSRKAKGGAR